MTPVAADDREAVLGDAALSCRDQSGAADDLAVGERDERAGGQRRLVWSQSRGGSSRPLERQVRVALVPRSGYAASSSSGRSAIVTTSIPSGIGSSATRRPDGAPARPGGRSRRTHALGELLRALIDGWPLTSFEAERLDELEAAAGEAPCRLRGGARPGERVERRNRARGSSDRPPEPGADDLSVEFGYENGAVLGHARLEVLDGSGGLVRQDVAYPRIQASRSASLSARRTSIIPTASACRGASRSARLGGRPRARAGRRRSRSGSGARCPATSR